MGSAALRNTLELNVPPLQRRFIRISKCDLCQTHPEHATGPSWQSIGLTPGSTAPFIWTHVLRNEPASASYLDGNCQIRKPKYYLELGPEGMCRTTALEHAPNWDAGDSFYIYFRNPPDEVNFILDRLGLTEFADIPHRIVASSPEDNGSKADDGEAQSLSTHLPAHCSPRQFLSEFVDIRRTPGRPILRALAEHAHNPAHRRRLLELSSAQGFHEFTRFVRQENLSLCDLFAAFPSLKPPLDLLLEVLPRLLPRPYSLACAFDVDSHSPVASQQNNLVFSFVYSVQLQTAGMFCKERSGVCTQWLVDRRRGDPILIVPKESSKFRFPPISRTELIDNPTSLLTINLVMVGPGTGVAPFIAFLQKLSRLHKAALSADNNLQQMPTERILFYASTNLEQEFLYKSQLEQFLEEGILTELVLCESSSATGQRPKRIYNALADRGEKVAAFLCDEREDGADDGKRHNNLLFACGDVKNMSRELWKCLGQILQKHKGFSPSEAMERLSQLRREERLVEDVWS